MLVLVVAASVHVELSPSSADSAESAEKRILTQLRSLSPPGTQREEDEDIGAKEEKIASLKTQVNEELQRLGVSRNQFTFVPKK